MVSSHTLHHHNKQGPNVLSESPPLRVASRMILFVSLASLFSWNNCICSVDAFVRIPMPRTRLVLNPSGISAPLFYQQNSTLATDILPPVDRFHRQADKKQQIEDECILTIHGNQYNLTAWANAHPGGAKVLQKFHDRDATKAFEAAHHSAEAHAMLQDFLVAGSITSADSGDVAVDAAGPVATQTQPRIVTPKRRGLTRARRKLFTKEDPIGFHKYLGIFCLLNFLGRYRQMLFGDPAAGLGTRGHPWFAMACLMPHAVLSLSSLIFHTVPKERVVGKPMIWQEFRAHNIIFGVRSVLSAAVTAWAIRTGNTPGVRKVAIAMAGATVLVANYAADLATEKLRASQVESTTATMPYWDGCSIETQRKFKSFYAYCQFMATLACLAVGNPAWPFAVLIAIQFASLLMTLVRKGLLSARGYHYGYTATLVAPWFVGIRSMLVTRTPEFPLMIVLGYALYQARRRGVNKYVLWLPVIVARLLYGDFILHSQVW